MRILFFKTLKNNKLKKIFMIILISIFIVNFLTSCVLISRISHFNYQDISYGDLDELNISNSDFNVLEFWNQEITRVNNTDLNIEYGQNTTLEYIQPLSGNTSFCEIKEIFFDSPNWVNASPSVLKLHGYLLFPEVVKSENPGCLCMHGLGNQANKSFRLAFVYLEKGFIVLCHSHPGHGLSEGEKPSPGNFFYTGDFNQTSHNYLTIAGAIQGLRVLENRTDINNSQIMVTGTSYGGLNTMWLAGICGERISSVNPIIAVGDNRKLTQDPTKLLFWIWDINPYNIPESFWTTQNLRIDPKYYLESDKMPKILFIIGTNDEFFSYKSIGPTFIAANTTEKYLQIHPNGHHVVFDYEESVSFFIESTLNGTQGFLNTTINEEIIEQGLIGSNLKINISISAKSTVKNVQLAYRYLNLLGTGWKTTDLTNTSSDTWIGNIPPSLFSSKVEYFIIVNIEGKNIWFTSNIFEGGTLKNNFSIFLFILFISLAIIPIIIIIWRRYNKNFKNLEKIAKKNAKKYLSVELLLIAALDILFYVSLLLPFANFGNNGVSWSTIHLFNHLFTWNQIFGQLTLFITPIFFLLYILNSYLCYVKPIIAGFCKLFYFIFMLLVYIIFYNLIAGSSELSAFGAITLGIGFDLILLNSIGLIILGIFKRRYKTKFHMRTPKRKIYNLDRWFGIKKF